MVTGWDQQLVSDPDQPALFFLRGGHWRWWSFRYLATAILKVGEAAPRDAPSHRVAFGADWPHHALATDLGLRGAGWESVPWLSAGEGSDHWSVPPLEGLATVPVADGSLLPDGGTGFVLWRGQPLSLESSTLGRAAEGLAVRLEPHLTGVDGRPIVLACGPVSRAETLVWCWWAARRGATLLLLRDSQDLPWATTWARPHLVLGSTSELRAAVQHHREHGPGRRTRGLALRFERLRAWVEVEDDEIERPEDQGEDRQAPEVDLGAMWTELGVRRVAFPSLPALTTGAMP